MSRRLLLIVAALAVGAALTLLVVIGRHASQVAVGTTGHEGHVTVQSEGDDTPPRSNVSLDTRRQQLIGVRTVHVERAALAPEIRAAGTVTYDETRQVEINTRMDGWIRDLYADYTGRADSARRAVYSRSTVPI